MEPGMLEQVNQAILELSSDETQTLLRHRLRLVRVLRGMTVTEAAKCIGVKPPFLSNVENGHALLPIERMIQLCGVYGVNWMILASEPKDSVQLFGVSVDSLIEEPEHAAV